MKGITRWCSAVRSSLVPFLAVCVVVAAACDSSTGGDISDDPFYAELWLNGAKVAEFTEGIAVREFSGDTEYLVIGARSGAYTMGIMGEIDGGADLEFLIVCYANTYLFANYIEVNSRDGYSASANATATSTKIVGTVTLDGLNPASYWEEASFTGRMQLRHGAFDLPFTDPAAVDPAFGTCPD